MADSKAPKSHAKDDDFVINDSTLEELDDEPKKKDEPTSSEPEPDADAGEPSGKELEQAMTEAEQEAAQPVDKKPVKPKHKWTRKKIVLLVAGVLIAIMALILAIPATRYATLGMFIKRDVTIKLEDTKTKKPVSNVTITLGDKSATTDAKGQATLKAVAVGDKKVKATKKYYKDLNADVLVPITGANPSFDMSIEATGRQVPIKVTNKISKQPVEGAQISVDGTSSKTDKNGEAVVVLPADKTEIDAALSQNGYNDLSVKVTVTEQLDDKNTFAVTPSGKLYFLSKRSGSIDVLKSDLDGANVQTVLKGTGKEDEHGTVLLASRDWKYLTLKARRDSDQPKLYLIETSSGKLSVIDEGDADFDPVGWYNTHFIYTVYRSKVKNWEPKRYSLKSFNATSGSLAVLDEAAGEGDNDTKFANEYIGNVYILDNEIVYQKSWNTGELYTLSGKNVVINSVRPDGSNKKTLKSFATEPGTYFGSARLYKPQEIYFEVYQKYQRSFWEYESNKFTEDKDLSGDEFYNKYYPTYLLSPSSKNTFWYEPRDGKNTLFVGDASGENGKELLNLSEFTPYGWMGEDYLLVSKKGSELFVIPRSNPSEPMKITDYHKPSGSFYGYGYGYGGF
jgi:hypothetical protein